MHRGASGFFSAAMAYINVPFDPAQLKLETLKDRIKRMAENIWSKLEDEDSDFFRETMAINMINPHNRYPSSYDATFN